MLNPATRFLRAEAERIDRELHRIELGELHGTLDHVLFGEEYRRRRDIIYDILPRAMTANEAITATEQKLADANLLLDELSTAGRDDVQDPLAEALAIDVQYLEGLLVRLKAAIKSETFQYALAGVKRL